jgi:hypothetical protein
MWICIKVGGPAENGTYFLNEYMLCENQNNICVFDSRGMPEVKIADGLEVLENWMVKDVRTVRWSSGSLTCLCIIIFLYRFYKLILGQIVEGNGQRGVEKW